MVNASLHMKPLEQQLRKIRIATWIQVLLSQDLIGHFIGPDILRVGVAKLKQPLSEPHSLTGIVCLDDSHQERPMQAS